MYPRLKGGLAEIYPRFDFIVSAVWTVRTVCTGPVQAQLQVPLLPRLGLGATWRAQDSHRVCLARYCFYPQNRFTAEPASSIQLETRPIGLFYHSLAKAEMWKSCLQVATGIHKSKERF